MLNKLIKNHPAYTQLLELLEQNQFADKYLPIVEITGITHNLYKDLLNNLSEDLNEGIITIFRDDQELRRYLDSALLVEFDKTGASQLLKFVIQYGYEKVTKPEKIGEFSIKGDILAFWPPGFKHPLRASFFDEQIESVVLYDEVYGKTYHPVMFFLLGDLAKVETKSQLEHVIIHNAELRPNPSVLIFGGDSFDTYQSNSKINFDFNYPALYFNRFDLLEQDIENKIKQGFSVAIVSRHKENLPAKLRKYLTSALQLESGFESSTLKTIVLTDKELFGTVFLSAEAGRLSSTRARKILANLEGEIEIGDYIVHSDHGVGIYQGIKQEEYTQEIRLGIGERVKKIIKEDYVLIGYAEGDELYVPLRQIDKLTKYVSVDDQDPELTRLGKTDWENLRKKAKESIFALAKELVELYAKRELATSPSFASENSPAYEKFVTDFAYQETPDQIRTEKEVLVDLSKDKPMNRLIVGDVGFGKTEIAMRAAFKVVEKGYQIAVLCPTTVLAAQHEQVFNERFKGLGFKIAGLSRLAKTGEIQKLAEINSGEISIVIGTHRLLSKDIAFENLGLLVIDEEQKFGVKQKEKLKELSYGIHVLSMSATPIPRSLSMALSSIQDISIIQTPPENRKAIKNVVSKMSLEKIKAAIANEVERGGQVYYVHNRVRTIQSVATKLQKLIPDIKLVVAHGQMTAKELTTNVQDFYEGKYDVLLCTTIIENGLDMPNVNTIIIEHAQHFGLGQLYQLRGRVGRSNKQAYAYFFYDGDEVDLDDSKTEGMIESATNLKKFRDRRKYKRRLQAIKEADGLGAGFKLASRDLEIRGAGNLLGKQQHGNIKEIGYALYMQMLAEEIEKLKN